MLIRGYGIQRVNASESFRIIFLRDKSQWNNNNTVQSVVGCTTLTVMASLKSVKYICIPFEDVLPSAVPTVIILCICTT